MTKIQYGLIGAAGYVAPLHMRAIEETGGVLAAAFDPHDSVGILDSHFPGASFFVEFERFERHIDKLRRREIAIDYIGICSPNYLHDAHVRFALRANTNAICEKPLTLNPWNIDALAEVEAESNHSINTILQLRLHPTIVALKKKIDAQPHHIHDVDLTYLTPRGAWYQTSWKGELAKSGGVSSNIGIHLFDVLGLLFGKLSYNIVHLRDTVRSAGYLEFERARVRWFLSIDYNDLPVMANGSQKACRSLSIDGEEVDFSTGFTDLHTESYRQILAGKGFGIADARPAIELVSAIRSMDLHPGLGERHPMVCRHI